MTQFRKQQEAFNWKTEDGYGVLSLDESLAYYLSEGLKALIRGESRKEKSELALYMTMYRAMRMCCDFCFCPSHVVVSKEDLSVIQKIPKTSVNSDVRKFLQDFERFWDLSEVHSDGVTTLNGIDSLLKNMSNVHQV